MMIHIGRNDANSNDDTSKPTDDDDNHTNTINNNINNNNKKKANHNTGRSQDEALQPNVTAGRSLAIPRSKS